MKVELVYGIILLTALRIGVIFVGDMAIAALSVSMNEAKTARDFSVGVLKMAMETEEAAMNEMMEGLADPNLGVNVDIMA